MRNKSQFLVNFIVRAILGIGIIFFVNQFFIYKGIEINVGINAISFVTSGLLGVPGVAMLYGVVATPFL